MYILSRHTAVKPFANYLDQDDVYFRINHDRFSIHIRNKVSFARRVMTGALTKCTAS